ncbi:MAG: response regulator [Geminocystis sp.]|nr:response regulator [Geminocystis sp.]HIK37021.1 response regulator transcription factor [Geminocystis sp. M7585_C2015_104]MCS7147465.1 response regulator [Geminocystis sp.]MCX8079009.1 response regulator [Geminocystis sp.]MDW8115158.1 response regulator [Geminocystis sp.]
MPNDIYEILLVEDEAVNAQKIEALLSNSQNLSISKGIRFQSCHVTTLGEAIETLKKREKEFAAIVLDLTLPDAKGFESLFRIRENFPDIPTIVQIESEDESVIVRAFQMGANGYIRRDELDSNSLVYALRLAIERQQYIDKLAALRQEQVKQKELASLESLAQSIRPTITAKMFASDALKDAVPDVFAELTAKYAELLELSLEQRALKVDYNIPEQLRQLAAKLGFFKASPRDVVDIHTKALRDKCQNVNLAKVQAYVDEGRLRLLELMGYLTSYYRKYYIGLSNLTLLSSPDFDEF